MKSIYIIAEAGVNHNGDAELARRLIDLAVAAKADAVKFQMFRAEALVTPSAEQAIYQKKNLGAGNRSTQYEMLKKLELSLETFQGLKKYADKKNITFLATPFDVGSADQLDELVDRFKISSGDCTNIPFLRHIAAKNKPVILSTGMATLDEVRRAVEILLPVDMTLLHCTSNYPCPFEEVHLKVMKTLRDEFHCPVGYSDHTEGIEVAVAAAALGACVIEKHFTLDRNLPGPDHKASIEGDALAAMVRAIRHIEQALGNEMKTPQASERETAKVARRSLVFSRDLPQGTILREHDLAAKRPGTGISPAEYEFVIGQTLKRAVQKDELVSFEALEST